MLRRATLGEIRTAIASTAAYARYAKCSVVEAVDVVCDYQGLTHDLDRRIVRRGVIRRQSDALVEAVRARRVEEGS